MLSTGHRLYSSDVSANLGVVRTHRCDTPFGRIGTTCVGFGVAALYADQLSAAAGYPRPTWSFCNLGECWTGMSLCHGAGAGYWSWVTDDAGCCWGQGSAAVLDIAAHRLLVDNGTICPLRRGSLQHINDAALD